jgi:signal transduction histidine kinase
MSTLIDELLDLSRLGRIELKRTPVDLGESGLGDTRRPRPSAARNGRWMCRSQAWTGCGLPIRNWFRFALQNLLDNAWKYTRQDRWRAH